MSFEAFWSLELCSFDQNWPSYNLETSLFDNCWCTRVKITLNFKGNYTNVYWDFFVYCKNTLCIPNTLLCIHMYLFVGPAHQILERNYLKGYICKKISCKSAITSKSCWIAPIFLVRPQYCPLLLSPIQCLPENQN